MDMRSGFGTEKTIKGSLVYIGDFVYDMYEGFGTHFGKDEVMTKGRWKRGKLEGKITQSGDRLKVMRPSQIKQATNLHPVFLTESGCREGLHRSLELTHPRHLQAHTIFLQGLSQKNFLAGQSVQQKSSTWVHVQLIAE